MKKLTSIFMALAMILALAVPALADGPDTTSLTQSSNFAGEFQSTSIAITMPSTLGVVLNPYKLAYSGSADVRVSKLADPVFSAPVTIKSASNVDLKVGMTITPTAAGDVSLVGTAAAANEGTEKTVYLVMQYGVVATENAAPSAATMKEVVLDEEKELGENDILTLPAGDSAPTYFGIKFTGDANGSPETPYSATDKVSVGIAFTFNPIPTESIQVKVDNVFKHDGSDVTVTIPAADWKFESTASGHSTVTLLSPGADVIHHAEVPEVVQVGSPGDTGYVAPVPAIPAYDEITVTNAGVVTIKEEYFDNHFAAYTTANAAANASSDVTQFVILLPLTIKGSVETVAADATADPVVVAQYDDDAVFTYNLRIVCDKYTAPTP